MSERRERSERTPQRKDRPSWRGNSAKPTTGAKPNYLNAPAARNQGVRRAFMLLGTLGVLGTCVAYFFYFTLVRPEPTPLIILAAAAYDAPLPPNAFVKEDVDLLTAAFPGADSLDPQSWLRNLPGVSIINAAKNVVCDWKFGEPKGEKSLRRVLNTSLKGSRGGPDKNAVVVYMGFHGMVDEEGKPCLLLGTQWRGDFESSAGASDVRSFGRERFRSVPVQDVLGWIDRAREKEARVLLLLDCHRIPRLWPIRNFENDFAESVSRLSVPDNVVIVQSCSGGQHGTAMPELGTSAFATSLAKAFSSDEKRSTGTRAMKADGKVTFNELVESMNAEMKPLVANRRARIQTVGVLEEVRKTNGAWRIASVVEAKVARINRTSSQWINNEKKWEPIDKAWKQIDAIDTKGNVDDWPLLRQAAIRTLMRVEQLKLAGAAYENEATKTLEGLEKALAAIQTESPPQLPVMSMPLWERAIQQASNAEAEIPAKSNDVNREARMEVEKALAMGPEGLDDARLVAHLPQQGEPVEVRFLRRLASNYLPPSMRGDKNKALRSLAIQCRRAIETTAYMSGDFRLLRVAEEEIRKVDEKRRLAEDQLFAGQNDAADALSNRLQDCLKTLEGVDRHIARVRSWIAIRDQALAEAPYWGEFVSCARELPDFDPESPLGKANLSDDLWAPLKELCEKSEKVLDGGTDDLEKTAERVSGVLATLRGQREELLRQMGATAKEGQATLQHRRAEACLAFPDSKDRGLLLAKLANTNSTSDLSTADARRQTKSQWSESMVPKKSRIADFTISTDDRDPTKLRTVPSRLDLEMRILAPFLTTKLGHSERGVEFTWGDEIVPRDQLPGRMLVSFDLARWKSFQAERMVRDMWGNDGLTPPIAGIDPSTPFFQIAASAYLKDVQDGELGAVKPKTDDVLNWCEHFRKAFQAERSDKIEVSSQEDGTDSSVLVKSLGSGTIPFPPSSKEASAAVGPIAWSAHSGRNGDRWLPMKLAASGDVDSTKWPEVAAVPFSSKDGIRLPSLAFHLRSIPSGETTHLRAYYRGHVGEIPFTFKDSLERYATVWKANENDVGTLQINHQPNGMDIAIVLDCSESMNAKLDRGDTRIDVAWRVLRRLVTSLHKNDRNRITVWLFGHRFGKSASRASVYLGEGAPPPDVNISNDYERYWDSSANGANEDFETKFDPERGKPMTPVGFTPLYSTLEHVVKEDLGKRNNPKPIRRVVVISDGEDYVPEPVKDDFQQGKKPWHGDPNDKTQRATNKLRAGNLVSALRHDLTALNGNPIQMVLVDCSPEVNRFFSNEVLARGDNDESGWRHGEFHNVSKSEDELLATLLEVSGIFDFIVETGSPKKTISIDAASRHPLPPSREPYVLKVALKSGKFTAESLPFMIDGGEQLAASVDVQHPNHEHKGALAFKPEEGPAEVKEGPQVSVDIREWGKLNALPLPEKVLASVQGLPDHKIHIRLKNQDEKKFSMRPQAIWAEVTPCLVEQSEVTRVDGEPIRYVTDLDFVQQTSAPEFVLEGKNWPDQATHAKVRLWFRYGEDPRFANASPIETIKPGGEFVPLRIKGASAPFDIKARLTRPTDGRWMVLIRESLREGAPPHRMDWPSRDDPQPTEIRHRFWTQEKNAALERVDHEFYFNAEPKSLLVDKPMLLIESADEIKGDKNSSWSATEEMDVALPSS